MRLLLYIANANAGGYPVRYVSCNAKISRHKHKSSMQLYSHLLSAPVLSINFNFQRGRSQGMCLPKHSLQGNNLLETRHIVFGGGDCLGATEIAKIVIDERHRQT